MSISTYKIRENLRIKSLFDFIRKNQYAKMRLVGKHEVLNTKNKYRKKPLHYEK